MGMNLLSSLCTGFAAAANGTAEIYVRGTSTRATWYGSFEGDNQDSSGANITLDSYGAATVYVNQLVDVLVKDADGNEVRSFVDGYASGNIEVRSEAFSGVDYTTGGTALGNPTTLQTILDRWATSTGSYDWNVDIGGDNQTLEQAFGSLVDLVFNVMSPTYGGVGDGVNSDQAAIQAALAAAVSAGGGTVFFPPGTYRITSAIVWDYRANILMAPGASLVIDHATNGTLRFTGANSTNRVTVFHGLTLGALQSNTGTLLSLEASQRLLLSRCEFANSANNTGSLVAVSSAQSLLEAWDCRFRLNGSTQAAFVGSGGGAWETFRLLRNRFVLPATYDEIVVGPACTDPYTGWYEGNVFDGDTNSTVSGGTIICVRPGNDGNDTFVGNHFLGAFDFGLFLEGDATVVGNYFNGTDIAIDLDGAGPYLAEGNRFASVTTRYAVSSTLTSSCLELDKYESLSGAGTSYSVGEFTEYTQISSSGAAPTVTLPDGLYAGQRRQVVLRNTSGGNWASVTISGAALSVDSIGGIVVPNGDIVMTSWIWVNPTGSYLWLEWQYA